MVDSKEICFYCNEPIANPDELVDVFIEDFSGTTDTDSNCIRFPAHMKCYLDAPYMNNNYEEEPFDVDF